MRIIAGTYRNRKLLAPKNKKVRPTPGTLREALFNICQYKLENASFLDLFAGSGAIGIEAISRGAVLATLVEKRKESLYCIRQNIKNLEIQDYAQIFTGDVFQILTRLVRKKHLYDIIFADPPYHASLQSGISLIHHLLQYLDKNPLLKEAGILFIEHHSSLSFDSCNLETLRLVNSRRFGSSILSQFEPLILRENNREIC